MSDLKKREKLAPSHIMSGEFTLYYLSVFISFNHHEGQLYLMDFNVIFMLSNTDIDSPKTLNHVVRILLK